MWRRMRGNVQGNLWTNSEISIFLLTIDFSQSVKCTFDHITVYIWESIGTQQIFFFFSRVQIVTRKLFLKAAFWSVGISGHVVPTSNIPSFCYNTSSLKTWICTTYIKLIFSETNTMEEDSALLTGLTLSVGFPITRRPFKVTSPLYHCHSFLP